MLDAAARSSGRSRRRGHDRSRHPRATRLLDATDDDWEHTFSDVLLATVHACRAAVPLLVDGGGGAIVTTAAYSVRAPKPHQVPYASLKAAVATLTKTIAKSFGPQGVRANCVCPGATETEILAAMRVAFTHATAAGPSTKRSSARWSRTGACTSRSVAPGSRPRSAT